MKTAYKLIIAALAAAAALSSCTKDIAADREDVNPQDGVRTIAVSFTPQTKTTLEGLQPRFDDGDVIKVSNGSECKDITIQVDPQTNNAFFTTTLTGALKAVYPATAAALEGNNITGVKVPAIQTGKFKEANICMANIAADANEATFYNKTAILRFYVDRSLDVRALSLTSQGKPIATETIKIDDDVELPDTYVYVLAEVPDNLADAVENLENLSSLDKSTDDPAKRICYVAVLPFSGENISFMGISSEQEAYMAYKNVSLGEGDIANAFIPYYIKVKVGGTNDDPVFQRWSYCNLGAFLPEEAGYYYSWGNTTGHWRNGVSDEYSFDSDIYAETPGHRLTKNIQANSEYDAAYVAWRDKWRIPTADEFETLLEGTEKTGDSENNLLIIKGTALKFPLSGLVKDGQLYEENDFVRCGMYWTSTISEYSGEAHCIMCWASNPFFMTPEVERYNGLPIRPIYGDPKSTDISIVSIPNGGML